MQLRHIGLCLPFLVTATVCCAEGAAPKRIPWTTSRIHGSPDPPKPYVAQRVFPKLEFKEALELVFEPVTDRWFALERAGKIVSWPRSGEVDHAELVANLKVLHPDLGNLFGLAFHPKFAENRQVFITYTRGPAGLEDGTKLSRFVLSLPSNVPTRNHEPGTRNPQLDLSSEQTLLTWRSGGHNGAHLQFGPDGMLYISTGDSEVPSPPDPLNTGQDLSDLLSSILRIDVDHADPGLAYGIPKDNPFIGLMVESAQAKERHLPGVGRRQDAVTPSGLMPARPEIWAYGLRNPWKMSFDRATGRLWCGDVGWELWEMIHLIERGGNYGWSAVEASQPVRADSPKAPTPIRPPVVAHSHDEAASITGGYVYHGKKFPELEGAYIYGDYVTGKIWALWHDGTRVTRHEEIADTHHKIIAFGVRQSSKGVPPSPPSSKDETPLLQSEPDGIYYLDYSNKGALYELVRNKMEKTETFPTKLSETGLFKTENGQIRNHLDVQDGVYEFKANQPMWQNEAFARCWIALPGEAGIKTTVSRQKRKDGTVNESYKTEWPADAVLAKTLFLDSSGLLGSHQPVETQLLHYDGKGWQAYSYRWNENGSDADLVPAGGSARKVNIAHSGDPHQVRQHDWRFHSRAECMRCHNAWCGVALSFQPVQLSGSNTSFRASQEPGKWFEAGQLEGLLALGLVDDAFAKQESVLLADRDQAARSYLHANCSHCHRKNAGGAVTMMLNAELLLDETRTVGVTPLQGGLGLADPKLIHAGNPWNSAICVRIAKSGSGHMPVIGPREVDVEGLKLIEDWIARMGDQAASATDLLPKEWSEPLLKEKLTTVDGAMQVRRAVDDGLLKEPLRQKALDLAWSSPLPTVRDLFDRFLPDDKRVATLGLNPDPKKILTLPGDPARGSQLLSPQGKLAACFACHLVNGAGRDFGPDLSKVATRLKPGQILESLLQPSKVIAPGYQGVSLETKGGTVQAGFIVKETPDDLAVKTPTGQTVTIPRLDIAKQSNLPASFMAEGLAQGLTAQEAADLLAFLNSLK